MKHSKMFSTYLSIHFSSPIAFIYIECTNMEILLVWMWMQETGCVLFSNNQNTALNSPNLVAYFDAWNLLHGF